MIDTVRIASDGSHASSLAFSSFMSILTSTGERANHIDPLGILEGARASPTSRAMPYHLE